ncbi:gamma-glutamylcyclotransferase family protein [Streptomyces sp. XD-27]|uniref:gamma-glutamylcyclotransferase family protein n=1 Tax=Streptomyces sp. XD-27 TaxID=3062779 RepID=UPI0026F41667|nr:gamma-glutamylcyclotransferase family protein [Streptomyces sp. XD-27]WKX68886.1 gamma-glutamylcyclotransferase family protein [Streptomyces sp. XD-27]
MDHGISSAPDALFAYGSLQFPEVLTALLGRVPQQRAASAPGWRAAALARRDYPGLVPAEGETAPGLLLTGLTPDEWRILDAFEDDEYELRRLPLSDGRWAWSYLWRGGDVLPRTWDAAEFRATRLAAFLARHTARG